ncbi:carbohydrate-binding module family 50 protein [Jackrogersella minutella]|nr:carbohydrate-binding module family 50 protein [Jackrogersella minutella]
MFTITAIIAALALTVNQAFAAPTSQLVARQGYISNCDALYTVVSGDTCSGIITKLGNTFSLSDFYTWNPEVGAGCYNLYPGESVCVGVTPTAPVCPAPTEPGLAANCKSCYTVVEGDTCYAVAQAKGITLANFLAWNPSINAACTNLQLGYNYCVGV